jgi:hypothetical protein
VPDTLDIPALQHAIHDRYGVNTRHAGAIDVRAVFGDLPWPGIVSVFDLIGHPTARMAYAWRYGSTDEDIAIILGEPPIGTAIDAVQAWLVSLRAESR